MAEKLALKKALFDELKKTNDEIKKLEDSMKNERAMFRLIENDAKLNYLQSHKEFVQRLIDICVNRNKF